MGNVRIVDVNCGNFILINDMGRLLYFDTYYSNGKRTKVESNTAISLSKIIDTDHISKTDRYIVNLYNEFDNNDRNIIKLIIDLEVNNVDINIISKSSNCHFISLIDIEYKYAYINTKINISMKLIFKIFVYTVKHYHQYMAFQVINILESYTLKLMYRMILLKKKKSLKN